MTIKDMAREEVVTVKPTTSAQDISQTLEEENVGSAVVVEDREAVGIVTDRDLALRVVGENEDARDVTAADVMTTDLFTAEADQSIYDVLEKMQEAGVRRVPVVENGELAGIVTLDDYIVLLSSELDHVSGVVQSSVPGY